MLATTLCIKGSAVMSTLHKFTRGESAFLSLTEQVELPR